MEDKEINYITITDNTGTHRTLYTFVIFTEYLNDKLIDLNNALNIVNNSKLNNKIITVTINIDNKN